MPGFGPTASFPVAGLPITDSTQAASASTALVGALVRQTGPKRSGSSAPAASLVRQAGKWAAAAASAVATRVQQARPSRLASSAPVGSLVRQTAKLLSAGYQISGIDLTATNAALTIMEGIAYDGSRYIYVTPHTSNVIAKVDRYTFTVVATLDLTSLCPQPSAFLGCFIVGGYLYITPHFSGSNSYSTIVRVDLSNFAAGGVTTLDMTTADARLTGGNGYGAHDSNYGYMTFNNNVLARFGVGANFDTAHIQVVDLGRPYQTNFLGQADSYCDGTYYYQCMANVFAYPTTRALLRIPVGNYTVGGALLDVFESHSAGQAVQSPTGYFFDDGTNLWVAPNALTDNNPPNNFVGLGSLWKVPKASPTASTEYPITGLNVALASYNSLGLAYWGHGFYDGVRYGYFHPTYPNTLALRVDTTNGAMETFDCSIVDPNAGYLASVTDGYYGYFCPFNTGAKLLRFRPTASTDSFGGAAVLATLRRAAAVIRQAATGVNVAALVRSVGLIRRASGSASGSLLRQGGAVRLASATTVSTISRAMGVIRRASVTTVSTLSRASTHTMLANAAAVATRALGVGWIISAASSAVGSLTRQAGAIRQTSAAASAGNVRTTGITRRGAANGIGSMNQRAAPNLSVAVAAIGSRVSSVGHRIVGIAAAAGSLLKLTGLFRSASAAASASNVRGAGVQHQGATAPTASLIRTGVPLLSVAIATIGSRVSSVGHRIATSTMPAALIQRLTAKDASVTTAPIATAPKRLPRQFAANAPVTAALGRVFVFAPLQAFARTVASIVARLFHLPIDCRTIFIPAENRIVTLGAENRTVVVESENRTILIEGC